MTTSTRGAEIPLTYDPRHGTGRDLFDPAVEDDILARSVPRLPSLTDLKASPATHEHSRHDPTHVRTIPGLGHEDSLASSHTLFSGVGGSCRVCGARFPEGPRREGHWEYHRSLSKEHKPLHLEARRRDELAASQSYTRMVAPLPPTQPKLASHVRVYGDDCIAETMAAYEEADLPLTAYATSAPQGRYTTPELHQLVIRLVARGFVVGAIARTLNIRETRVRSLARRPLAA